MRRLASVVVVVAAAAACGDNRRSDAPQDARVVHRPPCVPVRGSELALRPLGKLEEYAILATAPPGDTDRLFVVDRPGKIRVFVNDRLLPEPFIDLTDRVEIFGGGERGLLGLAFHPQYATNGQFFVFYTTLAHGIVERCTVSGEDPDRANHECTRVIAILHDQAGNHNGGMIEFGSDGYLYIGTGDGGGVGDPFHNAQNPDVLLGKILRIDVDVPLPGQGYGIPATNPYAAGGGRPEVFIRGLRNPWRFSFDRATGDLWIGDVGQGRAEEMTVLRPSQQRGANLGWSMYEGNGCCAEQDDHCAQLIGGGGTVPCDPAGVTFPQDNRDRGTPRGAGWVSIIAGEVYRGTCYPDLVGYHLYGDYTAGTIVKARLLDDDSLEMTDIGGVLGAGTSSIHADGRGELYVTNISGFVYHLEAHP